jgi:hypothetical protein
LTTVLDGLGATNIRLGRQNLKNGKMNGNFNIKDQQQAIDFFKVYNRTQIINPDLKAIAYLIKPGTFTLPY